MTYAVAAAQEVSSSAHVLTLLTLLTFVMVAVTTFVETNVLCGVGRERHLQAPEISESVDLVEARNSKVFQLPVLQEPMPSCMQKQSAIIDHCD